MMNTFRHIFHFLFAAVLFASCADDHLGFSPDDYTDGEATVSLEASFSPFGTQRLSRADANTLPATGFNTLSDFVILVYDKNGNLLPDNKGIINTDLSKLTISNVDRDKTAGAGNNPYTSDGSYNAEDKTLSVTGIRLTLPLGEYYIIGVANLGSYKEEDNTITVEKSTYEELTEGDFKDKVATLEGLRTLRMTWNDENLSDNRELLGVFKDFSNDSEIISPPNYTSSFSTIKISRPGMKLGAWLRRCVSKITVDFDGRQLRENVFIRIKQVKICDIPVSCPLGYGRDGGTETEGYKDYNNNSACFSAETDIRSSSQAIVFYDQTEENVSTWPEITKGTPAIIYKDGKYVGGDYDERSDLHTQSSPALYFYENMQGVGRDRTTHPDLINGGVSDKDLIKDEKPYGSYIEVEADYHSVADGNISDGKILYRFMLGKDVKTNYDAERNYHYKLTLVLRGNGNDYDWHIDFKENPGFNVLSPWYVSYIYNHDAMMPFSYNVPDGYKLESIEAKIISNPWYPSEVTGMDLITPPAVINPIQPADEEAGAPYGEDALAINKNDANGFLSLWVNENDEKPALTLQMADNNTGDFDYTNHRSVNAKYYYGESESDIDTKNPYLNRLNRSQRKYYVDYNVEEYETTERHKNSGRNEYIWHLEGRKYSFNIPVHTRPKVLVKQTGYSGNNPFVGYERTAQIKLTAHLINENTGEKCSSDPTKVNVIQVQRIVNPKGVYRRAGNNEPFHVRLLWLDGRKTDFNDVISRGPWSAEIVGDKNFITLDGKQKVSGSTQDPIDFTINFNRLNPPTGVRNAIVRVLYHNYTCIHLIFVRQGYDPQEITPGGVVWETRNLITKNLMAKDPRDEGSLFKFGNSDYPIDAVNNAFSYDDVENEPHSYSDQEYYTTPDDADFVKSAGPLWIAKDDGGLMTETKNWSDIANFNQFTDDGLFANAATMHDFQKLYWGENEKGRDPNYVEFGYGVLYADGATETLTDINEAYGYYRRDSKNTGADKTDSSKGMRGIFAYYYNNTGANDSYNARNVFFPIGRSGYGHRKNSNEWEEGSSDQNNNGKGILRYSCGRYKPSTDYHQPTEWGSKNAGLDFPYTGPLMVSMFIRNGAIYWAKETNADALGWDGTIAGTSEHPCYGLDLNYFSFDVNAITSSNVDSGGDAAFVRTVKR